MKKLRHIFENEGDIIAESQVDGCLLQVKENHEYRWFELGGSSIQSAIDKNKPEKILMPVSQALILFMLFKSDQLNILNLGLGGACIDRSLSMFKGIKLTSVEMSEEIINMAKLYFQLPPEINVVCQEAEQFINSHHKKSDVVICDLFIGEKNPAFLFSNDFYKRLEQITNEKGLISLNLKLKNNQQLLQLLLNIKQYFPYIMVIEFDDYSNIVLLCCKVEMASEKEMLNNLLNNKKLAQIGLSNVLPKITYIPNLKSEQ